jgi:integrase
MNHRDPKQVGLLLRIRPSGHRCWYFRYSLRNRVRWYRIGQVSVTQARKIAAKLKYEVAEGRDPQAERLAQRSAGTFAELHQRYVSEWASKRNKSWRQAAYLVRTHILPKLGRMDARSITRADVRAALGKIGSPTVANQTWAAASAVFTYGVKMEVVAFNPCRGIDANPTQARNRVLSDGEIVAIWPHLTPPLKTILLTGQRPGEVGHLSHLHIKDGGWWEMPGKSCPIGTRSWPGTKNGRDHRVWLPAPVREIIASTGSNEPPASASTVPNGTVEADTNVSLASASTGSSGPVGPVDGLVFERCRASRVMRAICKRLAMDPVRPHDLRRTWTTIAARLGATPSQLDRILNHADHSVTATTYNQYRYEREDAALMERVASHIVAVATGEEQSGVVVPMR